MGINVMKVENVDQLNLGIRNILTRSFTFSIITIDTVIFINTSSECIIRLLILDLCQIMNRKGLK